MNFVLIGSKGVKFENSQTVHDKIKDYACSVACVVYVDLKNLCIEKSKINHGKFVENVFQIEAN